MELSTPVPVSFRILGPLSLSGPDGEIPVPPGRQTVTLGTLLINANTSVATEYLLDVVWNHDPPQTARTQIQICISRLRRLLEGTGAAIETRDRGYKLVVEPGLIDVSVFERQTAMASTAAEEGRLKEAIALYRQALSLWRGRVLEGFEHHALEASTERLEELRTHSLEACLELELMKGPPGQVVGELTGLVQTYPFRERMRSLLMLALFRDGRQTEALAHYRDLRDRLVDELGLEPGPQIRELEQAILRSDPDLLRAETLGASDDPAPQAGADVHPAPDDQRARSEGPGAVPPRSGRFQLPRDSAEFVGRDAVIEQLRDVLLDPDQGVAVLTGRPGIGKSFTAIHVATMLADHFPDGQLYCDLRTTGPQPVRTREVLGRFLRALGLPPEQIPDHEDECATLYRSLLAEQQILVVLDDVQDEAQVLPLLPSRRGSAVLLTSRAPLTGLTAAHVVPLEAFSPGSTMGLLRLILGDRVEQEPEAAAELGQLLGQLPLGVRLAAARLAAHPAMPVSNLVRRLQDETGRLTALGPHSTNIRTSLQAVIEGVDPAEVRLLALVTSLRLPTLSSWQLGATLDQAPRHPTDLAEPLVDAHLLDVIDTDQAGESVFDGHALVRAYVTERTDQLTTPEERTAAAERCLGGWLVLTDLANDQLLGDAGGLRVGGEATRWMPHPALINELLQDPEAWYADEAANLAAGVRLAVRSSLLDHAWELLDRMALYLDRCGRRHLILELWGEVRPHLPEGSRGAAALDLLAAGLLSHAFDETARRELLSSALETFEREVDHRGRGMALRRLAYLHQAAGELTQALSCCTRATAAFTEAEDDKGVLWCTMLHGSLLAQTGQIDEARQTLLEALELARASADFRAVAQVMDRLGQVAVQADDWSDAEHWFRSALRSVGERGDLTGEYVVLTHLQDGAGDRPLADLEALRSRQHELREQLYPLTQVTAPTRGGPGRPPGRSHPRG